MKELVNKVLLIDDDKATNFYNTRVVSKHHCYEQVSSVQSGKAALEYLTSLREDTSLLKPDLIFLDINMPAMNGWEFLKEYEKLETSLTENIIVILLSTSSNPEDVRESIIHHSVADFINKPLSLDLLDTVFNTHFCQKQKKD
ncbi:response regulator [Aquimarina hainanensis]|uniref:Response regulator n=1 Tax=Aquimarina hainanensis TaxID=1578017 RepID=A0ABW5NDI8_9FLAO|nr:response regulator [Aquimarina sp. TRL1]QKX07271.1 response regulator [Aquimarina sp. TRL1]